MTADPSTARAPGDRLGPPILQMRGISKRFGSVQALDAVHLCANAGEVLAVIGENGAGKSTLMKVLGGVHQPDGGDIQVAGQAAQIRSVRDSAALGIAFIHQELNVVDTLDVAGNVFLGREPLSAGPLRLVDRGKMRAATQPYLDRLRLPFAPTTRLADLSIAQQQMVEIVKALSRDARVLIMDEPTSSLTLAETERLLDVVRELRASGVSVIYISHRLGEITQIADRVLALRDGRNAGELSRDEMTHDAMVRMMVGRDLARYVAPPPAGADSVVLDVSQLVTRRYPHRSVSFTVRKGELLGMAGLIGAGRSEVAQALFGVVPSLSGSVALEGRRVRVASPADAIRHGIYLAPEDRKRSGIIAEMSIKQNVTLPALPRYSVAGLIQPRRESDAARAATRRLSIRAPSLDTPVKDLSGGNQQKVVLAKWLSLTPTVIIFDEPTRGIDVGSKAELYELMRGLTQSGVAILMISSDMEELLNLSHRIAVMHEGSISGFLERAEATEESIMQLAVGGTASGAPRERPTIP